MEFATKNQVKPAIDETGSDTVASNTAVLAAGNVTAEIPLIVPSVNGPVDPIVFDPETLLSSQIPLAIFVVALESAPSNHNTHPGMLRGSKP